MDTGTGLDRDIGRDRAKGAHAQRGAFSGVNSLVKHIQGVEFLWKGLAASVVCYKHPCFW